MSYYQYELDLINHEANGSVIHQRSSDGYVNATQLCQVAKRRWHNYASSEATGNFLRALAARTGIRRYELIEEVPDRNGAKSIWVHPKVALHLAQWLSADFAVQVTEWVYSWLDGANVGQHRQAELPYHIRRHVDNQHKIPPTHFSILQELSLTLLGPLECHGYSLPEKLVPDISQGRMFCEFLRKQKLADPDALPTYRHSFPDGREVDAKLYPVEVLGAFRKFVAEVWMPLRAEAYFRQRDPAAIPFLKKVLGLEAPPRNSSSFKRLA